MPSLKSHTEPLGDRDFGAAWPIFVILVQNRRKVDDFLGDFFSRGQGGASAPKPRKLAVLLQNHGLPRALRETWERA